MLIPEVKLEMLNPYLDKSLLNLLCQSKTLFLQYIFTMYMFMIEEKFAACAEEIPDSTCRKSFGVHQLRNMYFSLHKPVLVHYQFFHILGSYNGQPVSHDKAIFNNCSSGKNP